VSLLNKRDTSFLLQLQKLCICTQFSIPSCCQSKWLQRNPTVTHAYGKNSEWSDLFI